MSEYSFFDSATIEVIAGNGGDGIVGWRREKYIPKGGPAGGDGGRGGNVYLVASQDHNSLLAFEKKRKFRAEDGLAGSNSNRSGRFGNDIEVLVPLGTLVYELNAEGTRGRMIGDLSQHEQKILVARGGKGGRGNQHFANSKRQAPYFCEPGEPAETKKIELELKLIAAVGIVGLPNAGKSSLIARISSSKAKIGDYAFTTLKPNLGVIDLGEGRTVTAADVPGLIEGASGGKGLGYQFLRHIERTKVLIHLLDGARALESANYPLRDYETVRKELFVYNPDLLEKEHLVILNKSDLLDDDLLDKVLLELKEKTGTWISTVSCATGQGLGSIINRLRELYPTLQLNSVNYFKADETPAIVEEVFSIDIVEDRFILKSPTIEGLLRVTDFENFSALSHLYAQLGKTGVLTALKARGIQDGDTILIGKRSLVWSDSIDGKMV